MRYASRALRGSVLVFISLLLSVGLGYVTRLWLSRVLGLEDYGLFYAAVAFVSFFALFRDLGFSNALVKILASLTSRRQLAPARTAVLFVLAVQAVLALAIGVGFWLSSDWLATNYFHSAGAAAVLQTLAIWFIANAFLGVIASTLQGLQRIGAYSIIQAANPILTLGLTLILASGGVADVAVSFVLAVVFVASVGGVYLARLFWRIQDKASVVHDIPQKLLSFALPVFIGGLGATVLGYMDTITLTAFRSLQNVAWYQVALPTASILGLVSSALAVVIFPTISELWAKRRLATISAGIETAIKFLTVLILPALVLFITFPEAILEIFFGAQYVPAASVLQILSFGTFVGSFWTIWSAILFGVGKPREATKIVLAMGTMNAILNILLVTPFGINGVAAATMVTFLGMSLLGWRAARRTLEIPISLATTAKTVLSCLLMLGAVLLVKQLLVAPVLYKSFGTAALGLSVYAAAVLLTGTVKIGQLRFLRNLLFNR